MTPLAEAGAKALRKSPILKDSRLKKLFLETKCFKACFRDVLLDPNVAFDPEVCSVLEVSIRKALTKILNEKIHQIDFNGHLRTLTLTRLIGLPPHAPVAQKSADQR